VRRIEEVAEGGRSRVVPRKANNSGVWGDRGNRTIFEQGKNGRPGQPRCNQNLQLRPWMDASLTNDGCTRWGGQRTLDACAVDGPKPA